MKALLLTALTLAGLPLLAQTSTTTSTTSTTSTTPPSMQQATPQPTQESMMGQVMSALSPAEKDQLMAARQKALTDNPNLQTEAMDLMQKNMALQSGTSTDTDRQAFRAQATAYVAKIRAAMVKADPTVEPVLQKVEAAEARLRAEYQASH